MQNQSTTIQPTTESTTIDNSNVRRSIYEYFTDAEIGFLHHLLNEDSEKNLDSYSEYKKKKVLELDEKLKQLRSF